MRGSVTKEGTDSKYLIIGRVCRPVGVAGEIKVAPLTDDSRRFGSLSHLFRRTAGGRYDRVGVERVRYANKSVILKLRDYDSRNDVESFRGDHLYIDRENAAAIPESSHYCSDITGCVVRSKSGVIGTVVDIVNAGSSDVYVVRSFSDGSDRIYIPAVKDVVKHIDILKKEIIIDVIDGLF